MCAAMLSALPAPLRDRTRDRPRRAAGVMFFGPDRIAYLGLLGSPATRSFGAITIYCSLGAPLRFSRNGRVWEEADVLVVPAYCPHRIASDDRRIGVLMLEPETVDAARLPDFLRPDGWSMDAYPEAAHRVRRAFQYFSGWQMGSEDDGIDIDHWFFGEKLPEARVDARIAPVVHRISDEPASLASADDGARLSNLSMSRFLHRFKESTGATFRGFRAWKRARSFLQYVNGDAALTDVALEIGYADSSHFSNSIRQMYGLTPKDMFKGSRRLRIFVQPRLNDAPLHELGRSYAN